MSIPHSSVLLTTVGVVGGATIAGLGLGAGSACIALRSLQDLHPWAVAVIAEQVSNAVGDRVQPGWAATLARMFVRHVVGNMLSVESKGAQKLAELDARLAMVENVHGTCIEQLQDKARTDQKVNALLQQLQALPEEEEA